MLVSLCWSVWSSLRWRTVYDMQKVFVVSGRYTSAWEASLVYGRLCMSVQDGWGGVQLVRLIVLHWMLVIQC